MRNKKLLIILFIITILINLLLIGKYYQLKYIYSKCNNSVHELEKEEELLSKEIMIQNEYLIKQYEIEAKDNLFSNVLLFNMNNEMSTFEDIIPDTTLVIWIPKDACNACVQDLLSTLSELDINANIKRSIYVIIETRNIKKVTILKEEYSFQNSVKFYGCKNDNIFTFNERPICFTYTRINTIRNPFIPILTHKIRTKMSYDFVINKYQPLVKKYSIN